MSRGAADSSLQSTLAWALGRMREKGFTIRSRVELSVDPKLAIMGYAKKEEGGQRIVISEWALDSEMLGGLVLHELAHIYFAEMGAWSHDNELPERILDRMRAEDGLRVKEAEYLIDAFNHLQNIVVDDIVFTVMDDRELEAAKRFFFEWVSDRPSGDPVLDAALLCRNAFAVASLKRRDLFEEDGEMHYRNTAFLSAFGGDAADEFDWLERFLETARPDWSALETREALESYFERVLGIMRASSKLVDLR